MLQLIQAILKDPEDPTQCSLLFANQVGLLTSGLSLQSGGGGRRSDVAPAGRAAPVPVAASARGPPARHRTLFCRKEDRALSKILPWPLRENEKRTVKEPSSSCRRLLLGFPLLNSPSFFFRVCR